MEREQTFWDVSGLFYISQNEFEVKTINLESDVAKFVKNTKMSKNT